MRSLDPFFARIILSLALFLAGAEILVRLFIGSPWSERLPLAEVMPDEDLGYRMVPGHFHYTYQVPVQLNSLGFRGPEVPQQKSAHEIRILALGDSQVYGQGVGDERLMTTLLANWFGQTLAPCTVKVINLGVRGYGVDHEIALLAKLGAELKADQILLFPYLDDFQVTDISRRYQGFRHFDRYVFDFSAPANSGPLWRWRGRQLLRHSAFLMWTYDLVQLLKYRDALENRLLQGGIDEHVLSAQAAVGRQLEKVAQWSKDHGLPVTLVPVPASPQLVTNFPQERYQSFFKEKARQLGLGYLDPLPVMQKESQKLGRAPVIPYDGHYDAEGQNALAVAVFNGLRQELASCR